MHAHELLIIQAETVATAGHQTVHTHGGQVTLEEGFSGKALPLHADLDSSGVFQGGGGHPHAP